MMQLLLAEPFGSAMVLKWEYLLLAEIVFSFITFWTFGIDKALAVKKKRRISEKTLLTLSALLGGPGGMIGMLVFHHKTRKPRFKLVYLFAFLQVALIAYLLFLC